jgi:hypothetical protein
MQNGWEGGQDLRGRRDAQSKFGALLQEGLQAVGNRDGIGRDDEDEAACAGDATQRDRGHVGQLGSRRVRRLIGRWRYGERLAGFVSSQPEGLFGDVLRREANDDKAGFGRIDNCQHRLTRAGRRHLQVDKLELEREEVVRSQGRHRRVLRERANRFNWEVLVAH